MHSCLCFASPRMTTWLAWTCRSLLKSKRPTWCHLLFYFTSYVLKMFRTLIYPSSGAWVVSVLQAEACNTDTTQTQPHQISNTQQTKNKTTDVVTEQHSRKLLMKDILISETCWVHKKWNKTASDIKLVCYSSTSFLYTSDRTVHDIGHIMLFCAVQLYQWKNYDL